MKGSDVPVADIMSLTYLSMLDLFSSTWVQGRPSLSERSLAMTTSKALDVPHVYRWTLSANPFDNAETRPESNPPENATPTSLPSTPLRTDSTMAFSRSTYLKDMTCTSNGLVLSYRPNTWLKNNATTHRS